MAEASPGHDLRRLLHALVQPSAMVEIAAFAGCLAAAALIVWILGQRTARQGSILFGDRIVDGALFPVLALLLAWTANRVLLADVPTAVFHIVLPILMSLAVIRLTVRVLRVAFPHSAAMRVVERSVSWIAWIAVVLWITGVLPLVLEGLDEVHWKVGDSQVSLRNLLEGALSAVVVLLAALWVSALIEARLLSGAIGNLSVRKMAANAVRALLLLVGLLMALSAAGLDLSALGVMGGALGVGIGLGLQKLAANYVSGFVVLAERSVHIGDTVKVDTFEGQISDINMRYTVIRAPNGREAIVPNEMMVIQRVENATRADPRMGLASNLLVPHGTDVVVLSARLLEAVRAVPRVVADPAPAVQLQAFTPDGLELSVAFSIADPLKGQANVRSDVNFAILRVLDAAGVRIPVPQRRMVADAPPPAQA